MAVRAKNGKGPDLEALNDAVAALVKNSRPKSPQELTTIAVLEQLDRLAGSQLGDSAVTYMGDRIILPANMEGHLPEIIQFLEELEEAESTPFEFSETYPFRPWDVAAAFQRAMVRVFGTVGIGKATHSFFGTQPPEYRTIPIGVGETMQVPWGRVSFSPLKAMFTLGATMTEDGPAGVIYVEAPRKYQRHMKGFLKVVGDELKERSIYRGQAIDSAADPNFIDLSTVDAKKVHYSQRVMDSLRVNFWSVVNHAETLRATGQSLKRSVLLMGPYGTGKTLAGHLTAQQAVEKGWTYILVRPGDDPYAALKLAKQYAPAVVWLEDLDVWLNGKDRDEVSRILDAVDNVQVKGAEVLCGFTTNFPELLEKGMLRPGRIDAVIEIGALDAEGFKRLISSHVPERLLDKSIDWDMVCAKFVEMDFVPAFATEAIGRAIRYSLDRGAGNPLPITTEDLVAAAEDLRPQLNMLNAASETAHARPQMEQVFMDVIARVLDKTVVDPDGRDDKVKVTS